LINRKKAWPINKLISAFKIAHVQRYSNKNLEEYSRERSVRSIEPKIARNKSLQKLIPHDFRKYKQDSIRNHINNYTFSPRLN
jgi:hypothetical protein